MDWTPGELIVLAVALAGFGCGVHALLTKTRNPTSAVAWLLVCFALPGFGTLLYLTLGQERLHRKRTFRLRLSSAVFRARLRGRRALVARESEGREVPHRKIVERLTGQPFVGGNRIDFHVDGEQAYPAMIEAVSRARSSVAVQFYIFDEDGAGGRFRDALMQKAQEGVEVRVLYDAIGSHATSRSFWRGMEQVGIKVHAFMPLSLPRHRWQVNLRNHRKLVAVDGRLAFTGSMNMGSRHLISEGGRSHDVMMEIEGPSVPFLLRSFARDWYFACEEDLSEHLDLHDPEEQGRAVIAAVESGPDKNRGDLHELLVTLLHRAEKSIVLVTPYFVPDVAILEGITTAAKRGVEVTLVVPRRTDSRLIDWARPNFLQPALRAGARVFERPWPLLHMKLAVIDDELSIVGSTNLDNRSFFLNFELDLVIPGVAEAARLMEIVREEIRQSQRVSVLRDLRPPLVRRLRTRLASLFAPVL